MMEFRVSFQLIIHFCLTMLLLRAILQEMRNNHAETQGQNHRAGYVLACDDPRPQAWALCRDRPIRPMPGAYMNAIWSDSVSRSVIPARVTLSPLPKSSTIWPSSTAP